MSLKTWLLAALGGSSLIACASMSTRQEAAAPALPRDTLAFDVLGPVRAPAGYELLDNRGVMGAGVASIDDRFVLVAVGALLPPAIPMRLPLVAEAGGIGLTVPTATRLLYVDLDRGALLGAIDPFIDRAPESPGVSDYGNGRSFVSEVVAMGNPTKAFEFAFLGEATAGTRHVVDVLGHVIESPGPAPASCGEASRGASDDSVGAMVQLTTPSGERVVPAVVPSWTNDLLASEARSIGSDTELVAQVCCDGDLLWMERHVPAGSTIMKHGRTFGAEEQVSIQSAKRGVLRENVFPGLLHRDDHQASFGLGCWGGDPIALAALQSGRHPGELWIAVPKDRRAAALEENAKTRTPPPASTDAPPTDAN